MTRLPVVMGFAFLVGCTSPAAPPPEVPAPPPVRSPTLPPEPVGPTADAAANCSPYAELAKSIMASRQAGIPMRDVMDKVSTDPAHDYIRELVLEAYELPGFRTEAHQQRAIVDFEDQAYTACLRGKVSR